jgi:hypothetical protein
MRELVVRLGASAASTTKRARLPGIWQAEVDGLLESTVQGPHEDAHDGRRRNPDGNSAIRD